MAGWNGVLWGLNQCLELICRVGNSESRTLYVNELLGGSYSGEYYTVRVYGASRSCNLASGFCSQLVWKTSAQKALDYESVLNHMLVISPERITSATHVIWESNNTVAIFENGGHFTMAVPQTDFYRISFDISGDHNDSESLSELCISISGVSQMNFVPLRSDMVYSSGLISSSCSPPLNSVSIRFLSSSHFV